VVDQPSLCWQSGRLVAQRDGQEWAQELGHYPGLEQLTRDAGTAFVTMRTRPAPMALAAESRLEITMGSQKVSL
jgi:hypothetical protein